jgi:ribosomal protein L11 methyltransferase
MTPDRWLTLTVRLAEAAVEAEPHLDPVRELVPQLLLEVGGAGVEESSDTFTTYLPPPEELEDFLATVRSRLNAFAPGRGQLEWGWQPHEDWEELWRQGLGPRRITPRIVVAPTWDTPVKNPGEILITLDPGMAFGTAEHATTRGCLRLLDGRVQQEDRVADIGSGSGILSIAAVHLGAKKVLAVELDPMSCDVARENLLANGVEDRVEILVEEIQGDSPLPHAPFQGIVANIQRYILVPLLPSFLASLVPGGWLILSGVLLEERDELLNSASHHGFSLDQEDQEGEWWSGAFRISNPGP